MHPLGHASSQEGVLTCALEPDSIPPRFYEAVFVGVLRVMKDSEMQKSPDIGKSHRGDSEMIFSGVIQGRINYRVLLCG